MAMTTSGEDRKSIGRKSPGKNRGIGWLFIVLLLFLLSFPLVADLRAGSLILDVLLFVVLIASTYAVSHQRKLLIIAIILAVPAFGFWLSVRAIETPILAFSGLALSAIFFLFVLVVLMRNVIQFDDVDLDTIYGAMSTYLLIGVTWSFFYAMVEISSPGAFNFGLLTAQAGDSAARGALHFFTYYSLVTLSTLGYGDITPLSPFARSLSALEAITGQLFIAITIARLVGTHIAQKRAR